MGAGERAEPLPRGVGFLVVKSRVAGEGTATSRTLQYIHMSVEHAPRAGALLAQN